MEIRPLAAADLPALLQLYAHLHQEDDPLPEKEVIESVWQQIEADDNHTYFGLFQAEQLLGSCVLCIIPNLTRGLKPYGVIENVVTHADHRRQGYGRLVLEHALQHAWSQNCYKVMLLTGRKSEAVFGFYESVGFDRHAKQAFLAKPQ